MLQVRNIHYSIGDRDLLSSVDWNLQPEKRFALVGPNGSGKTTFIRILTGEIEPQGGTITKPRNYTIGYLPQEEIVVGKGTVLENALAGIPEIRELEHKIHALHEALEASPEDKTFLMKLGPLEQRYQPDHPNANDEGYVFLPNVNTVDEMANMISASRSYQSNVEVMKTSKQLMLATLRMGQ